MTKDEWITRCARRLVAQSGCTPRWARMEAGNLAAAQAELNWASGLAWQSPEDAADNATQRFEEEE